MENWCKTNNLFHVYITQKSRVEDIITTYKSQLITNEDKQKSKPFTIYTEDEQNRESQ